MSLRSSKPASIVSFLRYGTPALLAAGAVFLASHFISTPAFASETCKNVKISVTNHAKNSTGNFRDIKVVKILYFNGGSWKTELVNNGNASALYAGFKMMRDLGVIARYPRLVVAQAENANPMYLAYKAGKKEVEPVAAKPTQATAIQIGNPVSAPRAMVALEQMNGIVEQASEQELADAAARADALVEGAHRTGRADRDERRLGEHLTHLGRALLGDPAVTGRCATRLADLRVKAEVADKLARI